MNDLYFFALVTLILIQQVFHYIERKDLYSRIQARDLTDYKTNTVKIKTTKPTSEYISL